MRRFLLLAAVLCQAQTPGTIRVSVNLVTVACSVSDRNGAPVNSLRREDFSLLDDGKPRDIQYFWQESDLPLTVGLIADVSGSEIGVIRKHREMITQFLAQVIGPRDRAFIVTVGREVKLLRDLTASIDDLRSGVNDIQGGGRQGQQLGEPCSGPDAPRRRRPHVIPGCGGTALWNGVYAAARLKMKPLTGRKALIVLTDGMDTGSFHTLVDAIEAAQSADTLVYTIREVSPMVKFSPGLNQIALALGNSHLRRLSEETGGQAFGSPKNPSANFTQIENELRNLYVLGFTPAEASRDGKLHKLQVKSAQAGLRIRARKNYAISAAEEK
jgi:VWFA-related protein